MKAIQLFRRQERDLIRSGRIVLRVNDKFYDFTEELWHHGGPILISALCTRGWFEPDRFLAWFEEADPPETFPVTDQDILLPPLLPTEVGKILALGKNFKAHAEEFGEDVPSEPLYFNKLPETLRGHGAEIAPPRGYEGQLDFEGELAVVIGRKVERVSVEDAFDCVGGYLVANDLTLRSLQGADRKVGHPWFRAKNFAGACPLGPGFVPSHQINPAELELTTHVNGELRQEAKMSEMVVSVPQAISYLSHHMPLHNGDIILMGTPAGVGALKDGDVVTVEITEIGSLSTTIRH